MKLTFPLALGLLFIGLKLTGYITWSWLWVLAPFWLGLAVVALAATVAFIFMLALNGIGTRFK